MEHHSLGNTKSEIDFRIEFRKEYGIDYLEAVENLQARREESERKWQNVLISNGIANYRLLNA